jgi:predicted ATPase
LPHRRTRWLKQTEQTFELEAELEKSRYKYRLVVEVQDEPLKPRVLSETLEFEGSPIFEFLKGEVHLFNDRQEQKVTYPFDWHRSALGTVVPRHDNRRLTRFVQWFAAVYCFRPNPFATNPQAEKEEDFPRVDLSNFASWYRHLSLEFKTEDDGLRRSLGSVIDGFDTLTLRKAGENVRILVAEFESGVRFGFGELSEGQRCLVFLYAILHFVLARGATVILDEPENFVALVEIQPWLLSVMDMIEDGHGQIILISHHPEIMNQLAPAHGVVLRRERTGLARIEEFHGDGSSPLPPAELIARGWDSAQS